MGFAYTIKDQTGVYFVTFTVHQWVNVFTRPEYIEELLKNLEYCQQHKGLEIYAWVVMTNHVHLIIRAKNGNLSDVIRDFKKYTAKSIFKLIAENPQESRKEWLLKTLYFEDRIWFWEEGYHGEEIYSIEFYHTKVDYIHHNPVKAGIVAQEEHYLNSSAGDFWGTSKGRLNLEWFG
jgi:putative transposase